MKILIWIGIIFLAIPLVGALIALIIGLYVNNPSTHNATAFDSKISNQYYLRDGKVVYVLDGNFFQIGGSPIEGADPDTFSLTLKIIIVFITTEDELRVQILAQFSW